MKRIKSFRLFESVNPDIVEKVCALYEDVKSISYILEDEEIVPVYRLSVIGNKSMTYQNIQKVAGEEFSLNVNISSCNKIRMILSSEQSIKLDLKSFIIRIENVNEDGFKSMDYTEFSSEVESYFNFLKDHLDYVPDEYIKIEEMTFREYGEKYYNIIISSDFFK